MGAIASAVVLLASGGVARAGFVVSGQSDGFAVGSNLTLGSLASANVSVNQIQGSAPSTYNMSLTNNVGAVISAGAYNLPIVGTPEVLLSGTTGLLNSAASSDINGPSATGTATGSTTVNNLHLDVLGTLVVPVLDIRATTLTTLSNATGSFGSMTATGTPTFTGLAISVLGIDVTALVEASAGALVDVSALTGVTGLKIGLDVMTFSGDGISSRGVVTDNLLVQFSNVSTLGGGVLNGSLVIGESAASIAGSAVPEPASFVMLGIGLVAAGVGRAYRKARKPVVDVA